MREYSCDNLKSDDMLTTNISYLHWKDKRENDQAFCYQMNKTPPACPIDRDLESKMWKDTFTVKTPKCVAENPIHEKIQPCSQSIKDWLLQPCPCPTHKNYLVQDDTKICSKQHQYYKNITKRKDISNQEDVYKRYCS